ncbi:MAG TPA: TonB-dependent receptor [Chitinophagaceae bacterium]|jgi:iron complex outermembrane receptor protein|nr:TonB-dependent receptor [Chitinophagaceae bacterium]
MKKRLRSLALIYFFLFSLNVVAQQPIKGSLISTTGEILNGATITVKGTNTAAVTNERGEFTINAPVGSTLVVSYVGYETKEVVVGSESALSISLTTAGTNMNEVIVVGYGTQRKRDLTGSITTISAQDFQKGQISTPEQLISGKVAGVSIISNSGQPGAGSTIRIRGGSSLRASNDPLFVIDGVPLDNSTISGSTNPLSLINANDIESFTILKDASAAAIYGTRAANGVIIITTKKGSSGGFKVNFSSLNSVSKIRNTVDVLDADQLRTIVNQRGTAAKKAMLGTANTDWQKEIYQTAFGTDNNIGLSGGIKNLPYRISLGYQSLQGILKTDKLDKTSLAVVLNPNFFDNHLKVNLNLKGSLQQARFGNTAAIGGAVSFDPTQPVMSKSGRYGGYYEWVDASGNLVNLAGRNPLGLLNQRIDEGNPKRSIGNLQLDYMFHFLPELRANVNLGYDVAKGEGTIFVSDSAAVDYLRGGRNTQYKQKKNNSLFEFYLNYIKDIESVKSRVDVTAGYSYNNYQTTTYNFADFNAKGVKLANTDPTYPFDKPENTLLSFFGRANYTYNNRYLLTATFRRDGSSRFAKENRWGTFPSLALAWKIKEESFLKDRDAWSDLKLRLGWGITGQQEGINYYDFLSVYALSSQSATYQFGNNYYQGYRPGGYNPNIKWEETVTSNIGLDFGFLGNRIAGTLDFYIKKTTDLLNEIPQAAGTNFSAFIIANVGDMENKGVELNINTQPIRQKDLSLDVDFNVTYNKNRILNLTVIPDDPSYPGVPGAGISGGIGGQSATISSVGYGKNTFNLYKQVYDSAGAPLEGVFVDRNSDGTINQDDFFKSKRADPSVFLGFSSQLTYKKFTAGFVLRGSFDNYVYNNNYSQTGILNQITGNAVLYNASRNYLDTRFIGNSLELLSDYYIENASFLKMDNVSIGYNVGKLRGITNLRLSANIQNVFVITKYKGLDPEVSNGVDNNLYPRPRIFGLGVNANF